MWNRHQDVEEVKDNIDRRGSAAKATDPTGIRRIKMNGMVTKLIVGGVVAVAGIVGVARNLMVARAPANELIASVPSPTAQQAGVPAGLQERMNALVAAIEARDAQAYAAN